MILFLQTLRVQRALWNVWLHRSLSRGGHRPPLWTSSTCCKHSGNETLWWRWGQRWWPHVFRSCVLSNVQLLYMWWLAALAHEQKLWSVGLTLDVSVSRTLPMIRTCFSSFVSDLAVRFEATSCLSELLTTDSRPSWVHSLCMRLYLYVSLSGACLLHDCSSFFFYCCWVCKPTHPPTPTSNKRGCCC